MVLSLCPDVYMYVNGFVTSLHVFPCKNLEDISIHISCDTCECLLTYLDLASSHMFFHARSYIWIAEQLIRGHMYTHISMLVEILAPSCNFSHKRFICVIVQLIALLSYYMSRHVCVIENLSAYIDQIYVCRTMLIASFLQLAHISMLLSCVYQHSKTIIKAKFRDIVIENRYVHAVIQASSLERANSFLTRNLL